MRRSDPQRERDGRPEVQERSASDCRMFGLGWPEVGIIGIVALLVFGPQKIPELGSALGKTLRGFKEEIDSAAPLEEDGDDDEARDRD